MFCDSVALCAIAITYDVTLSCNRSAWYVPPPPYALQLHSFVRCTTIYAIYSEPRMHDHPPRRLLSIRVKWKYLKCTKKTEIFWANFNLISTLHAASTSLHHIRCIKSNCSRSVRSTEVCWPRQNYAHLPRLNRNSGGMSVHFLAKTYLKHIHLHGKILKTVSNTHWNWRSDSMHELADVECIHYPRLGCTSLQCGLTSELFIYTWHMCMGRFCVFVFAIYTLTKA